MKPWNPITAQPITVAAAAIPTEATAAVRRPVTQSHTTRGARKSFTTTSAAIADAVTQRRSRYRQAIAAPTRSSGVNVPMTTLCSVASEQKASA